MARFDCTVMQNDVALCQATIDVREARRGESARGWEGAILATEPPGAIWEPGEYTFRFADGSDCSVAIASVRLGGGRITFVGSGPPPVATA